MYTAMQSDAPEIASRKDLNEAIEIEVYCSSDTIGKPFHYMPDNFPLKSLITNVPGAKTPRLTTDTQRAITKKLSKFCQDKYKARRVPDKISWNALADAPVCECCGLGPSQN